MRRLNPDVLGLENVETATWESAVRVAADAFETLARGRETEAAWELAALATRAGRKTAEDLPLLVLFARLMEGQPPLPAERLLQLAAELSPWACAPQQVGHGLLTGATPPEEWVRANEDLYQGLAGPAALFAATPEHFNFEGIAAEWEESAFILQHYGTIGW